MPYRSWAVLACARWMGLHILDMGQSLKPPPPGRDTVCMLPRPRLGACLACGQPCRRHPRSPSASHRRELPPDGQIGIPGQDHSKTPLDRARNITTCPSKPRSGPLWRALPALTRCRISTTSHAGISKGFPCGIIVPGRRSARQADAALVGLLEHCCNAPHARPRRVADGATSCLETCATWLDRS